MHSKYFAEYFVITRGWLFCTQISYCYQWICICHCFQRKNFCLKKKEDSLEIFAIKITILNHCVGYGMTPNENHQYSLLYLSLNQCENKMIWLWKLKTRDVILCLTDEIFCTFHSDFVQALAWYICFDVWHCAATNANNIQRSGNTIDCHWKCVCFWKHSRPQPFKKTRWIGGLLFKMILQFRCISIEFLHLQSNFFFKTK